MLVIPIINVDSFEEAEELIKMVEPYVDPANGGTGWVQIDMMHDVYDLSTLETSLKVEVHLMMDDIEESIEDWLIAPINRIIFQLEAVRDPDFVIEKCKKAGKEVGVSIAPDTPWTQLIPFCGKIDLFQILSVYPGPSGQGFEESSLEKIKNLRKNCPSAIIEVDGGINKEVAEKVSKAGADIVSASSYIFNSNDIKRAIKELNFEN